MSLPVVNHRRTLHRIPELDNQLPETTAYVKHVLQGLPCTVTSPVEGSVCAFFDAGREDSVAFRADMDALSVPEETGLPFASLHEGWMHACGHDGHTAIALSLAEYAAENLSRLPHNVLFLFQPSEESTGGAKMLCETGILETCRVLRIFGLHLWPGLAAGEIWSRPGSLMARTSEVTAEILGKSVHISRVSQGRDALLAGMEFLQRVYAMAEAELPTEEPRLLRFGKMESGSVRNAVSGRTLLLGTLRTYSDDSFRFLKNRLREIGGAVAEETGCAVSVRVNEGYPAVMNDAALLSGLRSCLGEDAIHLLPEPALAGEDFSFYQKAVPGVFFFLGTGDTPELHAPTFTFNDEEILPKGLDFMKRLLLLE